MNEGMENLKEIEDLEEEIKRLNPDLFLNREIKRLNNIDDKLEQRIAKLEKVLESHAKCIGEMRDKKDE